jgi:hypothetical protein
MARKNGFPTFVDWIVAALLAVALTLLIIAILR